MPIAARMGRVVSRLLEGQDEEAVLAGVNALEQLILAEEPANADEAALMLQVSASALRALDVPQIYVDGIERVTAWINRHAQ